MKITFSYTNGRKYTAKDVTEIEHQDEVIVYSKDSLVDGTILKSEVYFVPTNDLVGYVVKNGDETYIRRLTKKTAIKASIESTKAKRTKKDQDGYVYFDLETLEGIFKNYFNFDPRLLGMVAKQEEK